MRKAIAFIMVFAFVFSFATPLLAVPEAVTEVKDHCVDIISSPYELYTHIQAEYDAAEFKPFGVMGGIMKGTFYTVHKAVSGVIGILTMPLDAIK